MMRSTLIRCLAVILLVACATVLAQHGHAHNHGHAHDHGHGHAHGDDKPANKYSREANIEEPSVAELNAQKLEETRKVQERIQRENQQKLHRQNVQQQSKNTVNNAQLIADKKRALEEAKARAIANQKVKTEAAQKRKQEEEAERVRQAEAERLRQEEAERLRVVKEQADAEERRIEHERREREQREAREAEERQRAEEERRQNEEREANERRQRELETKQAEALQAEQAKAKKAKADAKAQEDAATRKRIQDLLDKEKAKAQKKKEAERKAADDKREADIAAHAHAHSHGSGSKGDAHAHSHVDPSEDNTAAVVSDDSEEGFVHKEHYGKHPMTTAQKALMATGFVSVLPVFILPFVPIDNTKESQRLLNVLLAFASGGLMGDVFLHLLPHALFPHSHGGEAEGAHGHSHDEDAAHNHDHTTYVGLWVLAGFMSFFLIEKIMRKGSGGGHGHSHATPAVIFTQKPALPTVDEELESERELSEGPPARVSVDRRSRDRRSKSRSVSVAPVVEAVPAVVVEDEVAQQPIAVAAYLNLVADFSHNFTDGLAIAAAYLAGDALGFSTMLAILFHEIPHEVGDYAILIRSGFSRSKAIVAQLSTAVGAMLGTAVGLMAQEFMDTTAWILPLTAGGFIYIATTTVIPDLLTDCSYSQTFLEILAMGLGVALMVVIAEFEE